MFWKYYVMQNREQQKCGGAKSAEINQCFTETTLLILPTLHWNRSVQGVHMHE